MIFCYDDQNQQYGIGGTNDPTTNATTTKGPTTTHTPIIIAPSIE